MTDQQHERASREPPSPMPSRHGTPDERPRRSYLPLERRTGRHHGYAGPNRRAGDSGARRVTGRPLQED